MEHRHARKIGATQFRVMRLKDQPREYWGAEESRKACVFVASMRPHEPIIIFAIQKVIDDILMSSTDGKKSRCSLPLKYLLPALYMLPGMTAAARTRY